MENKVIAVRVNSKTYTRRNNDADIAGALVQIISSLVDLKYKNFGGLINHYCFVQMPDTEFFAKEIVPILVGMTNIPAEKIFDIIELCALDYAE